MLDNDISTEDAKRLLSIVDDDPSGIDRRRFLQMVGWGVGGGAMLGTLGTALTPGLMPGGLGQAMAGSPIGPTDGILVLVGMDGGNDGLNTIVPYTSSHYYAQRSNIAIPANQVLPIPTSQVGFNNRLSYLKTLYDRGEVAIIQGVGYPNPDLSHFTSMALWMYGRAGNGSPTSGWVGRWLDGLGGADLLTAATVGQRLPLHLIGDVRRGTAIPEWGIGFGADTGVNDMWMYDAVRAFSSAPAGRGPWHDAVALAMKGVIDLGQEIAPVFDRPLPEADLQQKLTVVARLINADVGLRILDTSFGGFDNHSSQPGDHANLMLEFDAGLRAFFTTLDDRFRSRVTVMTYSEFGRTPFSNDSQGSDHGTANNHFVIGNSVRGGLYGQQPTLAGLEQWEPLEFHVDFRSMYASMLDGWMGGGSSTVLGGTFENLNLFTRGPGAGVATGSVPPAVLGDYVAITPARLYDSRNNTGGRIIQLGAGTVGEVQVLGAGGVPTSGVTAVALNITAVAATVATSFTAWPTGDAKPDVTNVSSAANRAVPNLVIVKVGRGGRINVANDLGAAHCVVDVVGYFRGAAADRLQPVTPTRLMDTRIGTGGRLGALGPASSHNLTVTGGSVPANATAVVVNLTAVRPSTKGYASAWPTGVTRPLASNLNFEVGQTVPNLAIVKVGSAGRISIYNHAGYTHFVVDVIGYMTATAPGRHVPLAAARLLDTRPDHDGSGPIGAAATRLITVLNTGGVPASAVSAVALNVTAIGATANGFVTVWPNGEARPTTSNLNPLAGSTVSNLVIVKVGTQGRVQLYNSAGSVNFVVDVVGYFTA